jgi:hypothetical protein
MRFNVVDFEDKLIAQIQQIEEAKCLSEVIGNLPKAEPAVTASECIEILKLLIPIQVNPKLVLKGDMNEIGNLALTRLAHLLKESAK